MARIISINCNCTKTHVQLCTRIYIFNSFHKANQSKVEIFVEKMLRNIEVLHIIIIEIN